MRQGMSERREKEWEERSQIRDEEDKESKRLRSTNIY